MTELLDMLALTSALTFVVLLIAFYDPLAPDAPDALEEFKKGTS